jgi:hypothetical protein
MASISDSTKVGIFVHLLDVLIKVGRYFPIISLTLACLNLFLAFTDFLTNSMGFGIIHSIFAISGFIFLIHMRQTTKANTQKIASNEIIIKKSSRIKIKELN